MTRRKRPANKDELLATVRTVITAAGGKPMSLSKFFTVSGLRANDIYDHFPTWHDLLRAAGFNAEPYHARVDDATLLADWAGVVRKLRRVPSKTEYDKHGKYNGSALQRRAGTWASVPNVFRNFAARRHQWKDVIPLLPSLAALAALDITRSKPQVGRKSAPVSNGRPIRGEHLGVGCLRYAPINEMGVVCLFTLMADRLGFEIEALQTGFPDCEASRRVGSASRQSVRIEFEFESRKYRDHGHALDGCDIIVCWMHNWPDCPKNLEVIALSEEVRREE